MRGLCCCRTSLTACRPFKTCRSAAPASPVLTTRARALTAGLSRVAGKRRRAAGAASMRRQGRRLTTEGGRSGRPREDLSPGESDRSQPEMSDGRILAIADRLKDIVTDRARTFPDRTSEAAHLADVLQRGRAHLLVRHCLGVRRSQRLHAPAYAPEPRSSAVTRAMRRSTEPTLVYRAPAPPHADGWTTCG